MPAVPTDVYSRLFFERIDAGCRRSAEAVVPELISRLAPFSVVDVGCGTGIWLAEFRRLGIRDLLGIDGPWVPRDLLQIGLEEFWEHDLDEPLRCGRTFDLALCLEVAEHLPESAAGVLVESLTRLAPMILFSAAVPGQGGDGHLNEQPAAWWENLFAARGFRLLEEFGSRFTSDTRVEWWYRQNMRIYASERAQPGR